MTNRKKGLYVENYLRNDSEYILTMNLHFINGIGASMITVYTDLFSQASLLAFQKCFIDARVYYDSIIFSSVSWSSLSGFGVYPSFTYILPKDS